MLTVYLVRHAEALNNVQSHLVGGRSDSLPLSDRGRLQAERLGIRLKNEQFFPEKLICSVAVRANETATIVSQAMGLGISPEIHPHIHEWDQGIWEGKPRTEVYTPAIREAMYADPLHFRPANGETPGEVETRMWHWLNEDVRSSFPDGGKVLAVSHGMAIRCLLRRILGAEPVMTFRMITHNTSLNVLHWDGKRWWLERLNDFQHVQDMDLIGPY